MARYVNCIYCGEQIDKEQNDFVPIRGRYAHSECANRVQAKKDKSLYKAKIHEKMQEICGNQYNKTKIDSQIKKYIKENGLCELDIYNTLVYWFDVKKGNPDQANGGIGIVPYVYKDYLEYEKKKQEIDNHFENISKDAIIEEIKERDKPRESYNKKLKIKKPKRVIYFHLD